MLSDRNMHSSYSLNKERKESHTIRPIEKSHYRTPTVHPTAGNWKNCFKYSTSIIHDTLNYLICLSRFHLLFPVPLGADLELAPR